MRYKCTLSYDGSFFHGFQTQANLRTVQETIEDVLLVIHKHPVTIYASGRTDAGVHAYGQVFHFDSEIDMGEWNMQNAINSRLPQDVYIRKVEKVGEEFHSRFSAKSKEYHYIIDLGEYDPLHRNYYYYPPFKKLDVEKMIEASQIFIGKHDFKSFTKNKVITDTVREIYSIVFERKDNLLTIKFNGNGFLHNMVRILVAMMVEVGRGKYSTLELNAILDAKNRQLAPKIAPANGLYLQKVYY